MQFYRLQNSTKGAGANPHYPKAQAEAYGALPALAVSIYKHSQERSMADNF